MTEQEIHAAYGLDPDGHNTYEAVDRIKQMLQYLDIDFLDSIDIDDREMADFDLADDQRLAADSEMWADTHGYERMADLARMAQVRLQAIEAFSLRLIRQTQTDSEKQFKENYDLRPWGEQLQDGDFDPKSVITSINNRSVQSDFFIGSRINSDLESAVVYAESYAEGLYPFVAKLVRDATGRYDGNLALALEAQFTFPLKLNFTHYRGVSGRIFKQDSMSEPDSHRVHIIDCPSHVMTHRDYVAPTREEVLELFHRQVDDLQNPLLNCHQ